MDTMIGLLNNIKDSAAVAVEVVFPYEYLNMHVLMTVAIGVLTMLLILWYTFGRKVKDKVTVLKSKITGSPKPRFRKRDKVLFYGRKMLRKVRSFTKNTMRDVSVSKRTSRQKQILRLARKFLRFRRETQPLLVAKEPPPSFLEADWADYDQMEQRLPPEVMYMLKGVRVLGHFEKPLFLELTKYTESKFLHAGQYLFKVGDRDESIFVVQSGKVNVVVREADDTEHIIKEVGRGDSIHSLLSILDVLTGHPAPYKTVSAVAVTDTTILRLPAQAFQIVLDRFPESLVRVVQIIMVRLQRVTFMALHNYLGLTTELINPDAPIQDQHMSVTSLAASPRNSPGKFAPSSASNISRGQEKVVMATNLDAPDDAGIDAQGMRVPPEIRRKSWPITRRSQEAVKTSSKTAVETEPSDFEVAMSQARIEVVREANPLVVGSPPVKTSAEDTNPPLTPSKRGKRATISDTVSVTVYQHQEPLAESETVTVKKSASLSDDDLFKIAVSDMCKLFGIEDEALLRQKTHLRCVRAGNVILKEGDQDASIYFVALGQLAALQHSVGTEAERMLFLVHPGQIVGQLAVLTGEPSFFTVRARLDSKIVVLRKQSFYELIRERPRIVLNAGHTVMQRMSRFVRQIDFALDWMSTEAGRALYRQGDQSDSIYIILNGRIRSVLQTERGKKELIGEYGRGELVGIVEVLTLTERATTCMAVRDTELAQFPAELLNLIKKKKVPTATLR